MTSFFAIALFALLTLSTPAHAADELEILSLQHRSVEDVLPSLQPLLEPGGVLTGMRGQLILRASPSNREQIRQALAALDTPLRQLRITVRQSLAHATDSREAEVYGKAESGPLVFGLPPVGSEGARVEARTDSARIGARLGARSLEQDSRVTQQLMVAEGRQAFIHAGTSRPLIQREVIWGPYGSQVRDSAVYQDVGSGFFVQPRLVGDRVSLDIAPYQQIESAVDRRVVLEQQTHTTLSARLGEWIEIGSGGAGEPQRERALAYARSTDTRQDQRVWLKVEIVE